MSVKSWDRKPRFPLELGVAVPTASFMFLSALMLVVEYHESGAILLEDDAYYYTIIANNIAHLWVSTFDGQTVTNGYHPLWLAVLVLQDLTFGASWGVTAGIELILASAGLWFFLLSFQSKSIFFRVIFVVFYTVLSHRLIERGMEVSLLLGSLGLFTHLAVQRFGGRENSRALGLAAVICIGARLDSAVFVLPVLILSCGGVRRSISALAPVAIAGSAYVAINLWVFGLAFPISGAIKSLGGLQLNRPLIRQALESFRVPGNELKGIIGFLDSIIGRPLLIFALTGIGFIFVKRKWKSWPIAAGFLVGFVLFAAKLLVLSSWRVWAWYDFPDVIGLVALFHITEDYWRGKGLCLKRSFEPAACLIFLVGLAYQIYLVALKDARTNENSFDVINFDAVKQFGPIFKRARVAMGDRAGSFAAHYDGPLTQLEGLVSDRAYLEALKSHADFRPLLCALGVHYLLSYQRDLGPYRSVTVPILRSYLTQFPSPMLTFSREDEVGRVFDLSKFDNSASDEGDTYLYAWRMGCAAATPSS